MADYLKIIDILYHEESADSFSKQLIEAVKLVTPEEYHSGMVYRIREWKEHFRTVEQNVRLKIDDSHLNHSKLLTLLSEEPTYMLFNSPQSWTFPELKDINIYELITMHSDVFEARKDTTSILKDTVNQVLSNLEQFNSCTIKHALKIAEFIRLEVVLPSGKISKDFTDITKSDPGNLKLNTAGEWEDTSSTSESEDVEERITPQLTSTKQSAFIASEECKKPLRRPTSNNQVPNDSQSTLSKNITLESHKDTFLENNFLGECNPKEESPAVKTPDENSNKKHVVRAINRDHPRKPKTSLLPIQSYLCPDSPIDWAEEFPFLRSQAPVEYFCSIIRMDFITSLIHYNMSSTMRARLKLPNNDHCWQYIEEHLVKPYISEKLSQAECRNLTPSTKLVLEHVKKSVESINLPKSSVPPEAIRSLTKQITHLTNVIKDLEVQQISLGISEPKIPLDSDDDGDSKEENVPYEPIPSTSRSDFRGDCNRPTSKKVLFDEDY